jgi:hypothetical protein
MLVYQEGDAFLLDNRKEHWQETGNLGWLFTEAMASACAGLSTSLDKPLASNGINHPDLLVIGAECGEKWEILSFSGCATA